jgi:hypothetical protein
MELETLIPAFAVLIALAIAIAVKAIVDTQHMRTQLTALSARVRTIYERVMRLDPGLAGAPFEAETSPAPVAEPEPLPIPPQEAVLPHDEPAFAPAPDGAASDDDFAGRRRSQFRADAGRELARLGRRDRARARRCVSCQAVDRP